MNSANEAAATIQIHDVDRGEVSAYYEMSAGKVTMVVGVNQRGHVTTLVKNAANRAWRGVGKTFFGAGAWEQALAAYKSTECKAMIEHVRAAEVGAALTAASVDA